MVPEAAEQYESAGARIDEPATRRTTRVYEDDEPNLGPDERDLTSSMARGSRTIIGRLKTRNWNAIGIGWG